jgi:hypothetical protein
MLSSYVGFAIGAALRFEYCRGLICENESQWMRRVCQVWYGMVWYAKDHAVAILPRDARQHMMQPSLVMRADEPRPRGKLASLSQEEGNPSRSESREESLHLSAWSSGPRRQCADF